MMRTQRSFRRPAGAGFTMIELMVVIIVVSLLGTVAADRLFYYRERAEKAMVDSTLELVKMGLRIRMAELVASNRTTELPQLERINPIRWMEEPPAGYVGEYVAPAKQGSWYYSTPQNELIYLPSSTSYLETGQITANGANGLKELRFRVVLRYQSENPTPGVRSITGIGLAPSKPYKWF